MHGGLFNASALNYAIVEKDYVGVLFEGSNCGLEWCSPVNLLCEKACGHLIVWGERHTLCSTEFSGKSSVWRRLHDVLRH